MDHLINYALWRWANRRHPNKDSTWIKGKYFPAQAQKSWVFAESVINGKGERVTLKLYSLAETPIERHRKVSGGYNPFDPRMEGMNEKLRMDRMLKKLKYRTQIVNLFRSQAGKCALCG